MKFVFVWLTFVLSLTAFERTASAELECAVGAYEATSVTDLENWASSPTIGPAKRCADYNSGGNSSSYSTCPNPQPVGPGVVSYCGLCTINSPGSATQLAEFCGAYNGPPPIVSPPYTADTEHNHNSCLLGSIVKLDSRAVGEVIPIVGSGFSLYYMSNRISAQPSNYQINIPVTGATVASNITGISVLVQIAGQNVTQNYPSPAANINYLFTWNGQDNLGNAINGSSLATITITTSYSGGASPTNVTYSGNIGVLSPVTLGLGGWMLSINHSFDSVRNIVLYGNGDVNNLTANPTAVSGVYSIPARDGSEVYNFSLTGQHLSTLYGLTGATKYTFSYDTSGRLLSVTDAFGNGTQFLRTAGSLTGVQSPYGQVSAATLSSGGWLASFADPAGNTYSVTYYTGGGLISTFQKPRGQVSTFTYDASGLLLSDTNSDGNSLNFSVAPGGFAPGCGNSNQYYQFGICGLVNTMNTTAVTSTSASGYSTTNTSVSTGLGFQSTATLADGSYVNRIDNYGQFESYTGEDQGYTKSFMPDVRFGAFVDFLANANITLPASGTTKTITAYQSLLPVASGPQTPYNFQTLTTSTYVNSTTNYYNTVYTNATGVSTTTSPVGRLSYMTTDSYQRPVSTQVATLTPISYAYDSNGRLHTLTQGSRVSTLAYNASGFLSSVTDALSEVTSYIYDSAGRVTQETLPDTRVINFTYDTNGNLLSVTPPSTNIHSFTMNLLDLVSVYEPPALGSSTVNTQYTYNNDNQLTEIQRPDGQTIVYNYSAPMTVLSSIVIPTGTYTLTWSGGQLQSSVSPDNITDQVAFDNNLLYSDYVSSSSGSLGYVTVARTSDFEIQTETVGGTSTSSAINYTYDLDTLLTAAGSETVTPSATTGLVTSTAIGSAGDSYTYDSFGAVATYTSKYSTTTLYTVTYTRDALGRVSAKSETIGGTTSSYGYTYDSSGRLSSVTKNSSALSSYTYDANSNRTSGNDGGVSFTATYDAQDRLLTYNTKSYTYNLNGEMATRYDSSTGVTNTFTFDALGHIKKVTIPSNSVNYTYDGLGRRSAQLLGTTLKQRYLYGDGNRVVAVLSSSGAISQRYVYGVNGNAPDYMLVGSTKYRIVTDQIGSVRLVFNTSNGTVSEQINYDEFGQVTSDTNPGFQPFGFAGGIYDQNTKLVHFGARDYDPSTGRWLSKDPIGFNGGDTNLYGYVMNDPINWIDRDGLTSEQADGSSYVPTTPIVHVPAPTPLPPRPPEVTPKVWQLFHPPASPSVCNGGVCTRLPPKSNPPMQQERPGNAGVRGSNDLSPNETICR